MVNTKELAVRPLYNGGSKWFNYAKVGKINHYIMQMAYKDRGQSRLHNDGIPSNKYGIVQHQRGSHDSTLQQRNKAKQQIQQGEKADLHAMQTSMKALEPRQISRPKREGLALSGKCDNA